MVKCCPLVAHRPRDYETQALSSDTAVTVCMLCYVVIVFQDGNPFGPFWDYVGVEFDTSVLFGGISFGAYHQPQWMKK